MQLSRVMKLLFKRSSLRGAAGGLTAFAAMAVLLCMPTATQVQAKQPETRIVAERELRFGTFMVFGTGTRSVRANGSVVDQSIVALEGNPTGPARFTVSYDRGNQSRHVLDIDLDMVISSAPTFREQGVEANVRRFETDLPGVGRMQPGQPVRIRLSNCRRRVCSMSFNVGGSLEVTRHYGGADLTVPIPIDVAVISVERR